MSDNFYWHTSVAAAPKQVQNFQDLNQLVPVTLTVSGTRHDEGGKVLLQVILKNPTNKIALMTHLQLRRKSVRRAGAAGLLLRQLRVARARRNKDHRHRGIRRPTSTARRRKSCWTDGM